MYRDPRLAGSWEGLLDRLTTDATTDRWAALEPALGTPVDLAAIAVELRPGVAPDRADELLGALVRLAAVDGQDEPDAVLVLLHLLSNGATALSYRLADLSDDSLPLVVGQLTVQIRAFPWRRRTRAYAANLLLDTRAALLRELVPHRTRNHPAVREVLIDPTDPRSVAGLLNRPSHNPAEDVDLDDVLSWATRTGVVPARDVALLLDVERTREHGGPAQLRVAAAWGINERTLRRRRDRALTALRQASDAYLAACA